MVNLNRVNLNKKVISLAAASTVILGGGALFVAPAMAATSSAVITAATDSSESTTIVDAIRSALDGLVDDGTITSAQADAVAQQLADNPPAFPGGHGPDGHGFGGHGFGGHGFGGPGGAGLDAAATALGITVDDIRTALEDGSSLATLAADKGVAKADLISAMVDAIVADINEHEAAEGEDALTEAEISDITERVTESVDQVGLPERGGRGRDGDWRDGRGRDSF